MEERYLYPGEEVQPVEVGEGYRDYWLSDVLKPYGGFVRFVYFNTGPDGPFSAEVAIAREVDGKREFLYHGHIGCGLRLPWEEIRELVCDVRGCRDLLLRYISGGKPKWVAIKPAFTGRK